MLRGTLPATPSTRLSEIVRGSLSGIAVICVAAAIMFSGNLYAEGDLTQRPQRLAELVMGSEESDYSLSEKTYELETGKAYRLEIVASGLKPYALRAPDFFSSVYLRKVEAGGMEIKALGLMELEFEDEGSAEIFFVPVKPGKFEFYIAGLRHKGMEGVFVVK
ncbi:copper-binding protein [uncultured Amphritea sp.]|uniref:copper-binding protein n=1 Tax=uncultured Amphritea sp. TaxID=981605 RepID=UPI0026026F82|nr:copper-binding protein [uncultured Amphritea sp.]